mmetsp:Transcript_30872/g.56721  ORF Transcript_30872/g.56721 Transcript_30872/m.56721 type:complete len:527 (-) Transcript_30872:110-1690(-)
MARIRWPRQLAGGYLLAEGATYLHYTHAKRRARRATPPVAEPADPDYSKRFLSLARCDAREVGSLGPLPCARFLRHAFFGVPPEALPREAVAGWLHRHLGDAACTEESLTALEAALGPCSFCDGAGSSATGSSASGATGSGSGAYCNGSGGVEHISSFAFGEGQLESWYKPLPLRLTIEARQRLVRWRMKKEGFEQFRDPQLPKLRFWVRLQSSPDEPSRDPPLVVLHGYGQGLDSQLIKKMVPAIGRQSLIIVDCSWLVVTRVPMKGDVSSTPTVREIALSVLDFLNQHSANSEVDILGHSFGTAVASALVRELEEGSQRKSLATSSTSTASAEEKRQAVSVRRVVLLDPMCFLPGITKQAQLLRRTPKDLAAELIAEAACGDPVPSVREVISSVVHRPKPCLDQPEDSDAAAYERRRWVIFQTYWFFYFIYRDLVYSWINLRSLKGPEYLDRGHLRALNKRGQLLTVLAETDSMIPAPLLRDDLATEAPEGTAGGVVWLPTVGHGACQHRPDVVERISAFLLAA